MNKPRRPVAERMVKVAEFSQPVGEVSACVIRGMRGRATIDEVDIDNGIVVFEYKDGRRFRVTVQHLEEK